MHRERVVVTDIAAGVGEVLAFHLGSDRAKITNDARLIDDLGADSLDVVEVVMSFEERFNIDIPNDVATKFVTVGDAVDFIGAQVAQAAKAGLVYHPARPRIAVG
jgi:acyl carrier protein